MACRNIWAVKIAEQIILPKLQCKKHGIHKSFLTMLVVLLFHLILGFYIRVHLKDYKQCGTFFCKKYAIMMIFWDSCILGIWYSLVFRRRQVAKLMTDYYKFQRSYSSTLRRSTTILNAIMVVYNILLSAHVIYFMVLTASDVNTTDDWYVYFELFETHKAAKLLITIFYFTSTRAMYLFSINMLCLFHIALFSSILQAITIRARQAMRTYSRKGIEIFIETYADIHAFTSTVESTISFEMFFMAGYQFSMIYLAISDSLSGSELDIVSQIDNCLMYLQISLFVATLFIASEIHNRDISLRAKMKDVIFQLRQKMSPENASSADLLSWFLESKSVITFTAWKMFSFTRTFFITSVGALFTYSLLILQIKVPKKSD